MKKIISLLIILCLITACKKEKIKEESIVGNKLDKPMIKEALTSDNNIEIVANLYCYGDINFDNEINELDIELYDFILNNDFFVDDNQLILADLDKDREITSKDKELLKEFLKNNNNFAYASSNLEYCISKDNDIDSCNWQKENIVDLVKEDYYIFTKNSVNNKTSNFYRYNHIVKEVASIGTDER